MNKILIVDDEESIRFVLKKGLKKQGYEVFTAKDVTEAVTLLSKDSYFLAFFDIKMPDGDGLTLLDKAKKIDSELEIIIMTANDTMQNAISAMQKGAYDYITKPFDFDEIFILIDRVKNLQRLKGKVSGLESQLKENFVSGEIIGKSKKMRDIFKIIGRAAASLVPVLITGESGTGKELAAKAIHQNSSRSKKPFIAVNCAAIPKELMESELFGHEKGSFSGAHETKAGKFELASGGTLFLDEIGDMDYTLQSKILRALQEKEFSKVGGKFPQKADIRIISATNIDIEKNISEKKFREDLFHRLNVLNIHLPSLRERLSDIPLLVKHFMNISLNEYPGKTSSSVNIISDSALDALTKYDWPGNIRELENIIKRAIAISLNGPVTLEHLPENLTKSQTSLNFSPVNTFKQSIYDNIVNLSSQYSNNLYDVTIKAVEDVLFEVTLKRTKNNKIKSAEILGINRNTLARKISEK